MSVRLYPALLFLLFLAGCTPKEKDLYDPDAQNRRDEENQLKSERSNATKYLGTQFSADQTWMMSARHTVKLNNLPANTDFDQCLVVTADPLSQPDRAHILAQVMGRQSFLSFESPNALTTLYAVCRASATGEAKVCSFAVSSGIADFQQAASGVVNSLTNQRYTYAFEDTRSGDYDLNDVVFRCWKANSTMIYIQLLAVGSSSKMVLYHYDNASRAAKPLFGGQELHQMMELLGNGKSDYYNTTALNAAQFPLDSLSVDDDFTFATAGFYILNQAKSVQVKLPASYDDPKGYAPFALCFPAEWKWPVEKTAFSMAYTDFADFALLRGKNDWYDNPMANMVVSLEE